MNPPDITSLCDETFSHPQSPPGESPSAVSLERQVAVSPEPPADTSPPAEPHSDEPLTDLCARLRAGGLRLTPARRTMLATLLQCSTPVTLTHLNAMIGPPRIALATLFRSMLRLEEIELVTRMIDRRGTANWELNTGSARKFAITEPATGQIAALDPATCSSLRRLLARLEVNLRDRGYTHVQLTVAFQGAPPALASLAPAPLAAPALASLAPARVEALQPCVA